MAETGKPLDLVIAAAMAGLAVGIAVALYQSANIHPDQLWQGYFHDRNGHYAFGQNLALAVRAGDPMWFFSELEKSKVWPPLHGLVLAAVLLVGGIDHRLGIVPSLIGWALTVAMVGLIARRMFPSRTLGLSAAAIALTLTIAAPAFRLLACDVMLECLGAGLTAAALWAYSRAADPPNQAGDGQYTAIRWRWLALVLTALFFEKGNYWGLTVAALLVTHLTIDPRRAGRVAIETLRRLRAGFRVRMLLDPLFIAAAVVLAAVAYLYWRGPTSILLAGKPVSLYPPANLLTIGYALALARLALWRHSRRLAIAEAQGPAGRALWAWHVTPIVVSFLLPGRLAAFLWFVGPANAHGGGAYNPLATVAFYWHAFADGFSAEPWVAALSLVLFVAGVAQFRRFSPGGRAVFLLAVVSFVGAAIHPQYQGRFLTSWVFAVWIGAGAGAATLLERLPVRRLALPVAGVAAAALVVVCWREPPAAAYRIAIHPMDGPSDLDFVRPVLPSLDGVPSVTIATTFGDSSLWVWAIRERCRCHATVELASIMGVASREDAQARMAVRIAGASTEAIVLLDAPGSPYVQPGSPYAAPPFNWDYGRMAGVVDAMAAQHRYARVSALSVPEFGATLSLWRLREGGPPGP